MLAQILIGCSASQLPLGAPAEDRRPSLIRPHVTYGVLYSFEGRHTRDSAHPNAPIINVNGTFYGTTAGSERGPARAGSVFTMMPSGTEQVLHLFKGAPKEGADPRGLINVRGTLFGTTSAGGSSGMGTAYSITPSGTEVTLHNFTGGPADGSNPNGLINVNGTLYGTTAAGGTNGDGTVFSLTSSGAETVIYNFKGGKTDGAKPTAPLIDVRGMLYGTTANDGKGGNGTVFAITPSGAESVLYSFKGGEADGAGPLTSLIDFHGMLYGTTWAGGSPHCGNGCGTVFAVTPSGKESVAYIFEAGTTDGAYPDAPIVAVHGTLYGTTFFGGASGGGTLFAITQAGKESMLHSFGGGGDGDYPEAALLNAAGTLYGTTSQGGTYGAGTIFSLTP
ncbi:MAG TPA: choice-of-anchor tandem repeat GloVer-containing protein [Candidatus Cybelea sp.]|nr:choice-of-anchor tandem repeat GloVer-containing protein [Candidatus Cybelea sp.]